MIPRMSGMADNQTQRDAFLSQLRKEQSAITRRMAMLRTCTSSLTESESALSSSIDECATSPLKIIPALVDALKCTLVVQRVQLDLQWTELSDRVQELDAAIKGMEGAQSGIVGAKLVTPGMGGIR